MKYNLTKKINEKWVKLGTFGQNQFGKNQASFKITKEFKDFIAGLEVNSFLNLSAFEETGFVKKEVEKEPDVDDEIPF